MPFYVGIAIAGAAGACARYAVDGLVSRRLTGFPWGTFVVNVSGAFALGVVFVVLTRRFEAAPWVRSTIGIGFLGGYTTFSTLSFDTYRLLEHGSVGLALANALGSLAAGVLAVYLGIRLGRAIA